MKHRHQIIAFTLAAAALLVFLYMVRTILPPFAIAFVIAWLLDPLLKYLHKRGCPRELAIAGIFLMFAGLCTLAIVFLVPPFIVQAQDLADDFPGYLAQMNKFGSNLVNSHHSLLVRLNIPLTIDDAFARYGSNITGAVQTGLNFLTALIKENLAKLLWLILIPLVGIYLLNYMDSIRKKAPIFLPPVWRESIVGVSSKMGGIFSAYIRGLILVSALYGIATGLILTLLGVKYAVIIGIMAGILSVIPYLGSIVTTTVIFLVSLASFDGAVGRSVVVTLVTLGINQAFDNIVTPKILGKSVGLNPLVSLFALMAGGHLFGLMGMILAVPAAACIQEIILGFYPELRKTSAQEKIHKDDAPKATPRTPVESGLK